MKTVESAIKEVSLALEGLSVRDAKGVIHSVEQSIERYCNKVILKVPEQP